MVQKGKNGGKAKKRALACPKRSSVLKEEEEIPAKKSKKNVFTVTDIAEVKATGTDDKTAKKNKFT